MIKFLNTFYFIVFSDLELDRFKLIKNFKLKIKNSEGFDFP